MISLGQLFVMSTGKILFITPYPLGKAPSQRFRFEQYFDLLKKQGLIPVSAPFFSEKGWKILYKKSPVLLKSFYFLSGIFNRLLLLLTLSRYHFIFIHREVVPLGPPVFEWIISKILGKKIIFDFDDAIWLNDPQEKISLLTFLKWKSKVKHVIQWSYKISCGNDFLATFARQFNSRIIVNPTTIDTRTLHNPPLFKLNTPEDKENGQKLIIGWTGTHTTLPYLEYLLPVFKQLEKEFDFELLVIANKQPNFSLPSLRFKYWNKETEIEDLLAVSIGVMPLSNDPWSQGKCGFKALQFMALNIPCVCSPVGVNSSIIEHGHNGLLCDTHEEWMAGLATLIKNETLRKLMGEKGRQKVIQSFSVDSNTSNFFSLFE